MLYTTHQRRRADGELRCRQRCVARAVATVRMSCLDLVLTVKGITAGSRHEPTTRHTAYTDGRFRHSTHPGNRALRAIAAR